MAKNILMDLAFENLHKCMGISDWKESDEVILVSSANKEQIESDESYHSAGKCNYLGKRICIFCEQVKRNNYITLHILGNGRRWYDVYGSDGMHLR
ncbi:TPA: hypothetical protein ACJWW5_001784 [Streptococcus pneumoniae]